MSLALLLLPATGRTAQQYQGLCSYVKIEILQELTLERVGFLATLTVTNNEGDASITDFTAALTFNETVSGAAGEDASGLFFVQPPKLKGISRIDGTGIIAPGETATVEWFIIPKLSAGGTTPEGLRYLVGATLAGSIYGQEISREVFQVLPDTITVKPDPELEITYFQPRDVDGDNPFTLDIVETPIPFTLGVLVKNVGYGQAKNIRIVSEQPRIVENRQGLLVVPQLIGSRVDDRPTDSTTLTVDLGDIQPGRCRKGAWDMITTLSGEFTEFKASYTHAPELGGRDTSLIRSVDAYFMVHEVMNDQPGRDNLKDFLAETLGGEQLIPDTLYESDCNILPVNRLDNVSVLSQTGSTVELLAVADIENWVFIRVDDPGQAKYPIEKIVRSDGKVLNPNNYWTHVRYREPDNAKLTYLNIFDFVSLGQYTYTVTYQPLGADTDPPVTTLRFSGPSAQRDGKYYVLPETQLFFLAEDASPVGTWYRLDGAADFVPAYPFSIAAAGEHLLEYYSEDLGGNVETPPHSATVVVSVDDPSIAGLTLDSDTLFIAGDTVSIRPTTVTIGFNGVVTAANLYGGLEIFRGVFAYPAVSGVPSSPTANSSAAITVGGENVDFYRYRLNGGAWSPETPVANPVLLTGLSGPVTLTVSGRSQHGEYHADAEAVTVSWTVDSQASPLAIANVPATPGRTASASLTVEGTTYYCYRVDGTYYRPDSGPNTSIDLILLGDGVHTVEVTARATGGAACPGDVPGTARVTWEVNRLYGLDFPLGTRVRSVDFGQVDANPIRFTWDGRTDSGVVVPPGWYSAKVTVTDDLGRATGTVKLIYVNEIVSDGANVAAGDPLQKEVHARGGWGVWQEQRNGNWDIFAMELVPAGAAVAITSNTLNQERPRTDGLFVVWEDRQADGTWDVWAKELAGPAPPFAVTATPAVDERRPAVYWPWVVYQSKPVADPDGPWQLQARHLETGVTMAVDSTTQNQLDPAVQRGRVVWQDFRDPGYGEIYLKDLRTGEITRLTNDPGGQYHPAIHDHWVVWGDNRNTQFDLYGYNLKRGVEVRLTDTPEDETRPYLNGDWVIYEEDAAGEQSINLRLLHLSNLASVQLTNVASAKERPCAASGQLLWVDSRSGHQQVMRGPLPDLQAVFNNNNMVAITSGMVSRQSDAHTLLSVWHEQAGVAAITRYSTLLPTPVAETASWLTGGPVGDNFLLTAGDFLWVRFNDTRILDLGGNSCAPLSLDAGVNAFSHACFPDGYSAYGLIRELGPANVKAVRLLEAETGNWRVAVVENGTVVGEDFAIPATAVLLLDVNTSIGPWRPGEGL